jgi:hypothetical protein
VVLYGLETWSLTLREEHRLRVFQKRVFRIFGPERNKVTGEWRKLHNEELVARKERRETRTDYWWGSQRERDD